MVRLTNLYCAAREPKGHWPQRAPASPIDEFVDLGDHVLDAIVSFGEHVIHLCGGNRCRARGRKDAS